MYVLFYSHISININILSVGGSIGLGSGGGMGLLGSAVRTGMGLLGNAMHGLGGGGGGGGMGLVGNAMHGLVGGSGLGGAGGGHGGGGLLGSAMKMFTPLILSENSVSQNPNANKFLSSSNNGPVPGTTQLAQLPATASNIPPNGPNPSSGTVNTIPNTPPAKV